MKVTAWPDREIEAETVCCPTLDLADALGTDYEDDVHLVGYYIPGQDEAPRLRVTSELRADARLAVWFVDLDRPLHAEWPSARAAAGAVTRMAAHLDRFGEYPIIYATRAGMRLVFPLETEVPCNKAEALLSVLITRLGARLHSFAGLELDGGSSEWNRCFRAPSVIRDGARVSYPVHYPADPWTLPLPFTVDELPHDGRDAPRFTGVVPDIAPSARDW